MTQTTSIWIESKIEKRIIECVRKLKTIGAEQPTKIYMNRESLVSLMRESPNCRARNCKDREPEYYIFELKIEVRNDLKGDTIIVQ